MENFGTKIKGFANQIGGVAGMLEKFVEDNILEKSQRDQNLRKLSLAVESFIKDSLKQKSFEKHKVLVKKLENFAGELPKYQTELSSGMDVRAQLTEDLVVEAGQKFIVPTGLAFAIPRGFEIQVRPRSGWAAKEAVTVLNTPGTIDADYRGEVKVILINLGTAAVTVKNQDRIAQLVLAPVVQAEFEEVDDLDKTDRGAGGFGSTGK